MPSALNVTSIVPVGDVIAAGVAPPEKHPSSGAVEELPPYTFTKSYKASVPNAENERDTAEPPVTMSQEHCRFDA